MVPTGTPLDGTMPLAGFCRIPFVQCLVVLHFQPMPRSGYISLFKAQVVAFDDFSGSKLVDIQGRDFCPVGFFRTDVDELAVFKFCDGRNEAG